MCANSARKRKKYIDNEIARIMEERYTAAVKLLKSKKDLLETIARRLLEIETMEGKEFLEIIESQKASEAAPKEARKTTRRSQRQE